MAALGKSGNPAPLGFSTLIRRNRRCHSQRHCARRCNRRMAL